MGWGERIIFFTEDFVSEEIEFESWSGQEIYFTFSFFVLKKSIARLSEAERVAE